MCLNSEAQTKLECDVQPVIGHFYGGNIRHLRSVGRTRDVLDVRADVENVTAVEVVADIPQTVAAPSAARRTRQAPGPAVAITITAAARRRFRIMQMGDASADCN